jgi:DNA ligase 1
LAVKNWPLLYTKSKTGELRFWRVSAVDDKIIAEHGVLDGATVRSERKATGKNLGRSNETSPEQQALLEAEADYTFKLTRKYSLTPEAAQDVVPLPMLAKDFKKAKNIQYPVDVQNKLDGCRCIGKWEGDQVVLISRSGKYWIAVPHINRALESVLPKGDELDGELYVHGKPFQWITSRAKKAHADSGEIELHVYDSPTVDGDDSLTWAERKDARVGYRCAPVGSKFVKWPIVVVSTYTAANLKEVEALHDTFVQQGYEGAIVRLHEGKYEYAHRSSSLLKLKQFNDAEFVIIGAKAGEGVEHDLVIWECKNDTTNASFYTRPKGTHEDRRKLLTNAASYFGEKLRVKFFGRTDDGLPRFPIAEGIRISEDMD